MEHAKRLVVILDLAERCHEIVAELKQLGVNAKFVANNPSGLQAAFNDVGVAGTEIFLMCCEAHYLSLVVANLRALVPQCGIVVVSELEDSAQRAELLRVGADAYFPRTVTAVELQAMLEAIQRRAKSLMGSQTVTMGPVVDNHELKGESASHWVIRDNGWTLASPEGRLIKLTYGEKYFIELLHTSVGKRVSREQLMSSKVSATTNSRAVDSLISRLRRKAAKAGVELPIKSVHGWGYSFAGKLIDTSSERALVLNEQSASTTKEMTEPCATFFNEVVESYKHSAGLVPKALTMMFQATLDARTGIEEGVEVQLHWRMKSGKLVRLNASNCADLNDTVVTWIYESAFQELCRELQSWASDYTLRIPVTLSIPLTILKQLYQAFIRNLLASGLSDGSVQLAVADYEHAMTSQTTQEMLSVLATLGIPVWLDNYVGVAENLGLLECWKLYGVRLSFDAEQSTLSTTQLKSLVTMTCKLCTRLGLKTTIMNLSSTADRVELQEVGADYLHGDAIALPLSRDGLLLALASSSKSPVSRSRYEYGG